MCQPPAGPRCGSDVSEMECGTWPGAARGRSSGTLMAACRPAPGRGQTDRTRCADRTARCIPMVDSRWAGRPRTTASGMSHARVCVCVCRGGRQAISGRPCRCVWRLQHPNGAIGAPGDGSDSCGHAIAYLVLTSTDVASGRGAALRLTTPEGGHGRRGGGGGGCCCRKVTTCATASEVNAREWQP